jgi:hypothetical protein
MSQPNRWLHLRYSPGFDDDLFALFQAHCGVWTAYVQAVLDRWPVLEPNYRSPPPRYVFFAPERSADRTVVTLPVGGDFTLGSRVLFENGASRMLSEFFPLAIRLCLEEGLTETINSAVGPQTFWRRAIPRPGDADSSR